MTKLSVFYMATIVFAFLQSTPSTAATFSAFAQGGEESGCLDFDEQTNTSVTAVCSTAIAGSGLGRLSLAVSATAVRNGNNPLDTTGDSRAYASFNDRLTFGITSGFFSIPVDILATISLSGDISESIYFFTGSVGAYSFSHTSGNVQSVNEVLFPISDSVSFIGGQIGAGANCGSIYGAFCQININSSNSVRFLGGTVLDVFGVPQSGVSVVSESGFDYLKGFEPHTAIVSPVPLPASALLLIGALGGIGALRRKHRH